MERLVHLDVGVGRVVAALVDGLGEDAVRLRAGDARGAHQEDAVPDGEELAELHHRAG